jgi:hypothetical protein
VEFFQLFPFWFVFLELLDNQLEILEVDELWVVGDDF